MQGYTAELAVSAIISSWCRGDAEQNQQPVAFTHENHCRNSSWKQVEQHNCDGIRNPLHRLDFFTPSHAFCSSSKHAYRDTRTYQSEGQFVQIRESGGGMASSHWGMYSRLPTLRVLTLRLRDVQFWLPIRNDRSWGRGIRTLRTPFLVNSFHRLISPV